MLPTDEACTVPIPKFDKKYYKKTVGQRKALRSLLSRHLFDIVLEVLEEKNKEER